MCNHSIVYLLGTKDNSHLIHTHSEPENLKKSRPKKLVKLKIQLHEKKILDQKSIFAILKMVKNQFLNWEKVKR